MVEEIEVKEQSWGCAQVHGVRRQIQGEKLCKNKSHKSTES